jgi:hypothetical protein
MNFLTSPQSTSAIMLAGFYLATCILLLSRSVRVFMHRSVKIADEEIQDILHSPFIPRISLVIPSGSICSVEKIYSLMSLQYGNYELVLVLEKGEELLAQVKSEFMLKADPVKPPIFQVNCEYQVLRSDRPGFRKMIVIEKTRSTLGESLNTAINVAGGQYVCIVTREASVFRSSLVKLLKPFLAGDENIIATSAAIRIRPVDKNSSTLALRNIRNFVLCDQGNALVVGVESFCEGIGMISRKDLLVQGGFSNTEPDPVRAMLYRLLSTKLEGKNKPRISYVPEVLVQTDKPDSKRYKFNDQVKSYYSLLKSHFSFRSAVMMLPVCFPGLPYLMLLVMMIALVLIGPLSGVLSIGSSLMYFLAGYSFLVTSSIIALFLELRFSALRYSRRELMKLFGASLVLPLKVHFPSKA